MDGQSKSPLGLHRSASPVSSTNYIEAEARALLFTKIREDASPQVAPHRNLPVLRVLPAEKNRAREIVARHSDKNWSLCDPISFAVLEARGVRRALTFDHHFLQAVLEQGLIITTDGRCLVSDNGVFRPQPRKDRILRRDGLGSGGEISLMQGPSGRVGYVRLLATARCVCYDRHVDFSVADTYDVVAGVVKSEGSVTVGMKRLVEHCAHLSPDPAWPEIGKLDFEGDAENLKTWIEKILVTEPPSANIAAFWFGIFDSLGPDGRASSSLYMAGAETYDPGDDGSWACSPVYFPEHRYAESAVLRSISGLLAGRDNGVSWLGSYMLPLAYAALAVKKAERSIPADIWLRGRAARAVAVGFDSGDFVTLPEIRA